ncbi:hypothetical protein [Nitrincola nitratireducens]|uniref:Uncharacterized protein n=1 Tax=Nitrincola nitratireducens TaxID=1229521 RepID=W9VLN3_9GAMM|nr:hypothetical protein D791_01572 [Nitrincola nitratireducens]
MARIQDQDTDYKVGQDNAQLMGLDFHNPVFPLSAILIIAFIVYALVFPESASTSLVAARVGPSIILTGSL